MIPAVQCLSMRNSGISGGHPLINVAQSADRVTVSEPVSWGVSAGRYATCFGIHVRRWMFLFLPVWLFLLLAIGGAGFYFAYRAPAITAMVVCWALVGGGIWASLKRTPP